MLPLVCHIYRQVAILRQENPNLPTFRSISSACLHLQTGQVKAPERLTTFELNRSPCVN